MPIQVSCPSCSKPSVVPESCAGKQVRCPSCGGVFSVAPMAIPVAQGRPWRRLAILGVLGVAAVGAAAAVAFRSTDQGGEKYRVTWTNVAGAVQVGSMAEARSIFQSDVANEAFARGKPKVDRNTVSYVDWFSGQTVQRTAAVIRVEKMPSVAGKTR